MRRLAAPLLAAAAFVLAGCATMQVGSHIERSIDFTQFRTFEWGPRDALPTGDPRLDRDTFFVDHMEGSIERHLAAKGYERAEPASRPDLLVHYHATTDRRMNVDATDLSRGYCDTVDCRAGVSEFAVGTLIVDVIDARTSRLIWRGWAQDSFEGVLGNRDRLAAAIEHGVDGMFLTLPARR